ncbi:MAG: hypothetical protein EAY69_00295 [Cytophagales bacterium]|nr:MAG: hypothetical protein EAY69_00295 [Cytophagales bacterium]
MKKVTFSFIFWLCVSIVAFSQNDKLIIGKWNFVDMLPSDAQRAKMKPTKEQEAQRVAMMKKMAEKSYYEFGNGTITILMDMGFGAPKPIASTWTFEDKGKTTIFIKGASSASEGGSKQKTQDAKFKIEKISQNELVLVSLEEKSKGTKMILKK